MSLRETHAALRQELGRLQQASYCVALIEQATETDTPLPGVFGLMRGLLGGLCAHPPGPRHVFAFELKLLRELGLQPDLESGPLTPGARQLARALAANDWPRLSRFKLSPAQAGELGRFLGGCWLSHPGGDPRGTGAGGGGAGCGVAVAGRAVVIQPTVIS